MHLVYIDESGNTGTNLTDANQPIFVLCALVIDEAIWLQTERELSQVINSFFPNDRPDKFEIHATDLRNGNGYFRRFSVEHRLNFRNAWLEIASRRNLKLIYRAIKKNSYQKWMQDTLGSGIIVNPHIMAFVLVARMVNEYISTVNQQRGIFISDENKEIVKDVEKAISSLRGMEGVLNLSHIIEKGFFIDSAKSLLIQLCDLCAYSVRKKEEVQQCGHRLRREDERGVALIEPLIHQGDEAFWDVIDWFTAQKKGAARE